MNTETNENETIFILGVIRVRNDLGMFVGER